MTAAMLLMAAALIVWPGRIAADRLRALEPAPRDDAARPHLLRGVAARVPARVLLPAAAGLAGLVAAGPLHAAAAALLAAVGAELRGAATTRRGRLDRLAAWERALDDASSALRAGSTPADALERAAEAAGGHAQVVAVLTGAASHARLGGDVATALRAAGRPSPAGHDHGAGPDSPGRGPAPAPSGGSDDPVPAQLAGAWALATRHGVLLADVVTGLRGDVASRRERAVRAHALLAGPRATAVILTALPGMGVLLGAGFGADPLAVLVDGLLGGALCLAGAVFLAAGLLWTDRIAGGAAA